MIIHKITNGFVTQRFDTETGEWLDQEFIAGDESHETAYGETETDSGEDVEDLFTAKDLPLVMVQPFKEKQRIEWDCAGFKWIEVISDGAGTGEVTSNLARKCPYCDDKDCYGDCEMSQWHLMDPETKKANKQQVFQDSKVCDDELESLQEMQARNDFNSSIDTMESFILSLACQGQTVTEFGPALSLFVECLVNVYMEKIR